MRIYIFIIFLIFSCVCNAQTNLVPNGDFEYFTQCQPQIENAPPWYDPTGGSSDYLNSCFPSGGYSVPLNLYGFQYAHSGNAYTLFGVSPFWYNLREYIAAPLLEPLKKDKKYCFQMYVSLSENSSIGINNVGAFFSNGAIDTAGQGGYIVNFTPQISTKSIITDTVNWVLVEGSFIANGGENNITIGCFVPDDNITYIIRDSLSPVKWAAYYIDDVSVYECKEEPTNDISIPNAFTPNGDGVNDVFKVHGQNIKTISGKIINRWGQELYNWSDVSSGWDGKFKGKDVPEGTYFYAITAVFEDGETKSYTGSILLSK